MSAYAAREQTIDDVPPSFRLGSMHAEGRWEWRHTAIPSADEIGEGRTRR
jgi:hypothetical protein